MSRIRMSGLSKGLNMPILSIAHRQRFNKLRYGHKKCSGEDKRGELMDWALGTIYKAFNQDCKILVPQPKPRPLTRCNSLICRSRLLSLHVPWHSPSHKGRIQMTYWQRPPSSFRNKLCV